MMRYLNSSDLRHTSIAEMGFACEAWLTGDSIRDLMLMLADWLDEHSAYAPVAACSSGSSRSARSPVQGFRPALRFSVTGAQRNGAAAFLTRVRTPPRLVRSLESCAHAGETQTQGNTGAACFQLRLWITPLSVHSRLTAQRRADARLF